MRPWTLAVVFWIGCLPQQPEPNRFDASIDCGEVRLDMGRLVSPAPFHLGPLWPSGDFAPESAINAMWHIDSAGQFELWRVSDGPWMATGHVHSACGDTTVALNGTWATSELLTIAPGLQACASINEEADISALATNLTDSRLELQVNSECTQPRNHTLEPRAQSSIPLRVRVVDANLRTCIVKVSVANAETLFVPVSLLGDPLTLAFADADVGMTAFLPQPRTDSRFVEVMNQSVPHPPATAILDLRSELTSQSYSCSIARLSLRQQSPVAAQSSGTLILDIEPHELGYEECTVCLRRHAQFWCFLTRISSQVFGPVRPSYPSEVRFNGSRATVRFEVQQPGTLFTFPHFEPDSADLRIVGPQTVLATPPWHDFEVESWVQFPIWHRDGVRESSKIDHLSAA